MSNTIQFKDNKILFDGNNEGELERAEALAGELSRICIEMGGSITGEHGVGMEKRHFLPEMFDAATVEVMDRVRRAMDPKYIANPGKMFPGEEAPALGMTGLHPLEKEGVISRE